jgi:signal transduction histidine kinase
MAKRFVKISLATKFRLLFGAAVLSVIAAALVVPWYWINLLAAQSVQHSAAELARLRFQEFLTNHPTQPGGESQVLLLNSTAPGAGGRKGPNLILIRPDGSADRRLDEAAHEALKTFARHSRQDQVFLPTQDEQGRDVYRYLEAVRTDPTCASCHGGGAPVHLQYPLGQLVGMIDVALPASQAQTAHLVWWTRGAFLLGGTLAGLVAFVLFAIITHRLVLRPVRYLRQAAERVTEGDLTVRSNIHTGDELQVLGESFNEMLTAVATQHEQLRAANRALDLKLNELAEANVTLFQANQVKNEFLANVSHELRTPLNSIIGFADLLCESADERIRRYGQNVATSARSLLSMINDLLDLARIEAGRAEVRLVSVSVTDTCQMLYALMKPLADKKQLQFVLEMDPKLPLITTDPGKFQQILYNLLSNAAKFTPPEGKVTLSAAIGPATDQPELEEVTISVADTGPGIPESEQQRIFEKFYQGDRSLTREASGTGLGLAISRELANLLGGRLSLKSAPGQGATFTLTLPREPRPSPKPPAPAPQG